MIKNNGNIQNTIYNNTNNKYRESKINWDASYDGELAKVNMDINDNGSKKHINMTLNNEDLAELLNVPSVNKDLYIRLKKDFERKNLNKIKSTKLLEPLSVELNQTNVVPLENQVNDIENFHESMMKKYTPKKNYKNYYKNRVNKYSRKYSKNNNPKTMRLYFNRKKMDV